MNEETNIVSEEKKAKRRSRVKKILPHPATFFIFATLIVIFLSWLLSLMGLEVNYTKINPTTGSIETSLVAVKSLLNSEGLRYVITNVAKNFINFAPLAMIIISFIGIGVAEKSGLLKTVFQGISKRIPNVIITFVLVFLAIISNITTDLGYVILIPLGALLFLINGRHPLAGMAATFTGIAGGFGANLIISSTDKTLSTYSTHAANILDKNYQVSVWGNWYFMIIASVLLAIAGTIVTEKIIIKKLGKYELTAEEEEMTAISNRLTPRQKKGLAYSILATILVVALFTYEIIPGFPYSGLLLDTTENGYFNQLFGASSYFQEGLVAIFSIIFLIAGLFYGIGAKTIKNDTDLVNAMSSYMNNMGTYIVIIFFASQFIAIFKQTNIGTIIAARLAELVETLNFSGIPLILLILFITVLANIFVTSPTIKWSILAPVIIPTAMKMNFSPEFTQLIFKAGDSISNGITPLLAYLAIFIAIAYKYERRQDHLTVKKIFSLTIPYSIAFALVWILLLLVWYFVGIPLGPGALPTI